MGSFEKKVAVGLAAAGLMAGEAHAGGRMEGKEDDSTQVEYATAGDLMKSESYQQADAYTKAVYEHVASGEWRFVQDMKPAPDVYIGDQEKVEIALAQQGIRVTNHSLECIPGTRCTMETLAWDTFLVDHQGKILSETNVLQLSVDDQSGITAMAVNSNGTLDVFELRDGKISSVKTLALPTFHQ